VAVDAHRNLGFIHSFPTGKKASEQGFLSLSTDMRGGYCYYLYIQKPRSQANPTTFFLGIQLKTQLTKKQLAVQDFQLKKKRVAA
jgi:hypothetical protein